jgi:LysM domain
MYLTEPRISRSSRLRLTRRGRGAVIGLLVLVVSSLIAVLAPASRASDPPGPASTAVVLPGDTLWSIAERHAPSQNPFAAVEEIRRLNGLDGYTVYAGQRVSVPSRR